MPIQGIKENMMSGIKKEIFLKVEVNRKKIKKKQ